MAFSRPLSADQIHQFQTDGYLVIEGFYDLEREVL
jgi:hypothetical protein